MNLIAAGIIFLIAFAFGMLAGVFFKSALDHGRIALGDLITDLKQLTEKKQ